MNQFFTPQTIFDCFIALGGAAFVVAQIQIGRGNKKSGEESDALTIIRIKDEAIKAAKEENVGNREELKKLGEEMAVIRSENSALKVENIKLKALVENRNPELETFIKTATDTLMKVNDAIQKVVENQKVGIDGIHAILNRPTTGTTVINQPLP